MIIFSECMYKRKNLTPLVTGRTWIDCLESEHANIHLDVKCSWPIQYKDNSAVSFLYNIFGDWNLVICRNYFYDYSYDTNVYNSDRQKNAIYDKIFI